MTNPPHNERLTMNKEQKDEPDNTQDAETEEDTASGGAPER